MAMHAYSQKRPLHLSEGPQVALAVFFKPSPSTVESSAPSRKVGAAFAWRLIIPTPPTFSPPYPPPCTYTHAQTCRSHVGKGNVPVPSRAFPPPNPPPAP